MTTIDLTTERKAELTAKGFYIEDMGKEWGSEWEGAFRWMKKDSHEFQDGCESWSEESAWRSCDEYDREMMIEAEIAADSV